MDAELIILTTSSKRKNLCVAGIDVRTGDFIRLVSDNEVINFAIPCSSTRYLDGSYCSPLDVVKVPIIEPRPLRFQPENILVDQTKKWIRLGQASLHDVINIHPFDDYDFIFGNASFAVNERTASALGYSLTIVEVEDFELYTVLNADGQPRSRCRFQYRGCRYNDICVTDPSLYRVPTGSKFDKAVLVVSIPNDGPWFYKFVSKVFFPSPHP